MEKYLYTYFFITDDYGRARNKARLAEDFSDLNSGNESNSKRKRIQKVLSSSSEDESNPSLLPPLPKCSTVTQFRGNSHFFENDGVSSECMKDFEISC